MQYSDRVSLKDDDDKYLFDLSCSIVMTWVVSIDESGNLGKEGRYFSIAATIVMRPRHLMPAWKAIPKTRIESKFYNSTPEEIRNILTKITECKVEIVSVTIDKHRRYELFGDISNNDLYQSLLSELLGLALEIVAKSDVNILLDRNTFLSMEEFRRIAKEVATESGSNIKKCDKQDSHQSKCIQIVDYIVGAIRYDAENERDDYTSLFEEKVSVARRY